MNGIDVIQENVEICLRFGPEKEDIIDISFPESCRNRHWAILKEMGFEMAHKEVSYTRGHGGSHGCTRNLVVNSVFKGKKVVF